jgi:hypothetical protein
MISGRAEGAQESVFTPEHPLLAGRTGRGVTVAIIDSGVHPTHPHVGGLVGGIAVRDDGSHHGDVLDRLGHGTAVAAAIHERAPDAELYIVRVFNETLSTNLEALIAGIEWAIDQGVRLINLSLGTANPANAEPLAGVVERSRRSGSMIISARAHGSRTWFPGSLPHTIGAELAWEIPRSEVHLETSGADLIARASGYPRPIPGVPPARNLKGVSFAVANATGLVACMLEGRDSLTSAANLRRLLSEPNSTCTGASEAGRGLRAPAGTARHRRR